MAINYQLVFWGERHCVFLPFISLSKVKLFVVAGEYRSFFRLVRRSETFFPSFPTSNWPLRIHDPRRLMRLDSVLNEHLNSLSAAERFSSVSEIISLHTRTFPTCRTSERWKCVSAIVSRIVRFWPPTLKHFQTNFLLAQKGSVNMAKVILQSKTWL